MSNLSESNGKEEQSSGTGDSAPCIVVWHQKCSTTSNGPDQLNWLLIIPIYITSSHFIRQATRKWPYIIFFFIFVKQSTFMIEQSELNRIFWRKKNKNKCWIMIIAEWNNDLKSNTYWYKSSNSLTLLVYNFLVPLFISLHLKLRENLALKDDVYHPHLKS